MVCLGLVGWFRLFGTCWFGLSSNLGCFKMVVIGPGFGLGGWVVLCCVSNSVVTCGFGVGASWLLVFMRFIGVFWLSGTDGFGLVFSSGCFWVGIVGFIWFCF